MDDFLKLKPGSSTLFDYTHFPEAFTTDEINKTKEYLSQYPLTEGKVAKKDINNITDNTIRKVNSVRIQNTLELSFLFDRVLTALMQANQKVWGYDLAELHTIASYCEYDGAQGHHMDWHLDIYTQKNSNGKIIKENKITGLVFLTNPDLYLGGELEILRGQSVEVIPNDLGSIVLFPTTLLHRVKPVSKGVRSTVIFNFLSSPFK